jgi:Flp pilus assembly protein TadG
MADMKPVKSWFRWLLSEERRMAERQENPGLASYYWDGASPVAHMVRDISSNGIYVFTEQRWYPGTLLMMTLQRVDSIESGPERSIAVWSEVVRPGADGVGFAFVLPQARGSQRDGIIPLDGADKKTFETFVQKLRTSAGNSILEYILLVPLIFLLIVNMVNFGGFVDAWITVANAARAGADYAIMGGASVGSPRAATAAQINSLITTDISSLPNAASLTVNICQNNNGTITALAGTCSTIPSDPESSNYVLTTIDVTYTYVPFIPVGFKFPNLNVYATIPPATVHRRSVMRSIQ